MKNYWKKILMTIGIVGSLSLLAVPIVSCSTNFNGTVITINQNGFSITHLTNISSDETYKLSTNSSNVPITNLPNDTKTVNLRPTITYNKDKTVPCVISLITQNGSIDAISRISWNSTTKSWDVFNSNGLVFSKVDLINKSTTFEFSLSLVNPPANTFENTEYYFSLNLINLVV